MLEAAMAAAMRKQLVEYIEARKRTAESGWWLWYVVVPYGFLLVSCVYSFRQPFQRKRERKERPKGSMTLGSMTGGYLEFLPVLKIIEEVYSLESPGKLCRLPQDLHPISTGGCHHKKAVSPVTGTARKGTPCTATEANSGFPDSEVLCREKGGAAGPFRGEARGVC